MPDYDDTNRGALFRNDKKQSEKHPDYRGSVNVDGVEYWVSSWIKTSKRGEKFMSLSFTAKEPAADPESLKPVEIPDLAKPFDDEIPF